MTARNPLYVNDDNDLQEMTASQLVEVQNRMTQVTRGEMT